MPLMQSVGERNVRIVPDVAFNGAGSATGRVDGLPGLMLRQQTGASPPPATPTQFPADGISTHLWQFLGNFA